MKKYLFPIFFSLFIGICMAYMVISRYDKLDNFTLSTKAEVLYYLEFSSYKTKDDMIKGMDQFESYIYNVEDNEYYTYLGITKDEKNAKKLQDFYKQKGYDLYIRAKITDNLNFVDIVKQYDVILSQTNDSDTIMVVCNQILSKYEEMVNSEYKD